MLCETFSLHAETWIQSRDPLSPKSGKYTDVTDVRWQLLRCKRCLLSWRLLQCRQCLLSCAQLEAAVVYNTLTEKSILFFLLLAKPPSYNSYIKTPIVLV